MVMYGSYPKINKLSRLFIFKEKNMAIDPITKQKIFENRSRTKSWN